MAAGASAYLVVRRPDGFGDVSTLRPGSRCTIGRATSNRVVLKDDMCSREHAELYFHDGQWYLRDLGSLNGTRVNHRPIRDETALSPGDTIEIGSTQLVFVQNLDELPELPRKAPTASESKFEIRARLTDTQFGSDALDRPTSSGSLTSPGLPAPRQKQLARLYRLALTMGTCETQEELVEQVLDGLMELVNAEVGAVLFLNEENELELQAHRHRDPQFPKYQRVSKYVSNEVLATRQAILAEDVTQDRHLSARESLTDLQVSSLICTPIQFRGRLYGVIHLYCLEAHRALNRDDLDVSLAVANQFGMALFQLRRRARIEASNRILRDQLKVETELVGSSDSLKAIEEQIARVAATHATVLIRGESGVGKELVARAIHLNSPRREGPFVTINCAALTESLLESELFGHEKGAFTGATERLIGKFESAHQGTIFLDEIGEMSLSTQAKFLRVLEGHSFERVGGNTPIKVDVRVVAATNRPLEEAVRSGAFRRDLFFRLQVVEIQVPPLRDRPSDIPTLAEYFLTRFVKETGRRIRGISPAAMQKLQSYHWPGNVRELRNVIERAVALAPGPTLEATDIWLSSLETTNHVPLPASHVYTPMSLEELEKKHILETLHHTKWNKSQAAAILGIERSTLDRKIKTYDIRREKE